MRRLSGYLPLVALALLTVSCESSPSTAPKGNGRLAADRQESDQHERGHRVTGRGKDIYPDGSTFSITFNARGDQSGVATGQITWQFPDGFVESFGSVYCLEVRGHRAYMSYLVKGGNLDVYGTPGNSVLLGFEDNDVEDNDEESGAPADRQTYIYAANTTAYPCKQFADFIDAGGPGGGFPVLWKGRLEIR